MVCENNYFYEIKININYNETYFCITVDVTYFLSHKNSYNFCLTAFVNSLLTDMCMKLQRYQLIWREVFYSKITILIRYIYEKI